MASSVRATFITDVLLWRYSPCQLPYFTGQKIISVIPARELTENNTTKLLKHLNMRYVSRQHGTECMKIKFPWHIRKNKRLMGCLSKYEQLNWWSQCLVNVDTSSVIPSTQIHQLNSLSIALYFPISDSNS